MKTFVNAVITGFGFSLGKLLFEKVKDRYIDPNNPKTMADSASEKDFIDVTNDDDHDHDRASFPSRFVHTMRTMRL